MRASYDFAESILEFMMAQPTLKAKNCCVVLDHDGTLASEDPCANYETFSRAVDFVKAIKMKYKTRITIAVITARISKEGLQELYAEHEIDDFIDYIMYDERRVGTEESKVKNRARLREMGYTIVMAVGDNTVADMIPDSETSGSKTANILLSNVYRHEYD